MMSKILTEAVARPESDEERQVRLAREADARNTGRAAQHLAMTLEGLADVDAGRLVDDEDMRIWVDGLGANQEAPALALMRIRWTSKARSDVGRLYEFLAPHSRPVALRAMQSLRDAPARLLHDNPRIGVRIEQLAPREVRRLIVGDYEMRYEISGDVILILRLWHTREDR